MPDTLEAILRDVAADLLAHDRDVQRDYQAAVRRNIERHYDGNRGEYTEFRRREAYDELR